MSDKSKLSLTTLIASTFTVIGYSIYAFGSKAPARDDIRSWAIALLIYIGISIIFMIIVQILFRIIFSIGIAVKNHTNGEIADKDIERIVSTSMKEDEMDKQISLRAVQVNFALVGIGCIVALVLLALNIDVIYALHSIFVLSFIGGYVEGIISIYCYEKGI